MDKENNKIIQYDIGALVPRSMSYHIGGWRLMQACAVSLADQFKLSYCYVKGYELETIQLIIDKEAHIPSISHIYPCAFLYENEMAELFGVKIDMISTDYHGKLYRIDTETPFKGRS